MTEVIKSYILSLSGRPGPNSKSVLRSSAVVTLSPISSHIQGGDNAGGGVRDGPILIAPLPLSNSPPTASHPPPYQTPHLRYTPPAIQPPLFQFVTPTNSHQENPPLTLSPPFEAPAVNTHPDTGYVPKPKLKFPLFNGVEGWLYTMEQVLDYYQIAREQRVRMAAMHLRGSSLQWYRWLLRTSQGVPSW